MTVDSAGHITVVECKLGTNSDMRRTVVGQLFAYAAGLWRLSYDDSDREFSSRAGTSLVASMRTAADDADLDWMAGLSPGGAAAFATLSASASYIAAPAAVRIGLPEANPRLSLTAALAITFPFNLVMGIPLYHQLAPALFEMRHGAAVIG